MQGRQLCFGQEFGGGGGGGGDIKWKEKVSLRIRGEEDLRSHLGQSILLEKDSDSDRAQHNLLIFRHLRSAFDIQFEKETCC